MKYIQIYLLFAFLILLIIPKNSIGNGITISGDSILCSGGSSLLSVNTELSTDEIISYQWKLNSINIFGAVSNQYMASKNGIYSVTILSSAGKAEVSKYFNLIEVPNPNIIINSSSSSLCSGSTVYLQMIAILNGKSILSREWLLDGLHYSNDANLSVKKGGDFTAILTNNFGCSDSSPVFHLVENESPIALIAANSQKLCSGTAVNISSNVVLGSGSIVSYQWQLNGIPILGATKNTYTSLMSGNYSISVISSKNCSVNSNTLNLKLEETPIPLINGSSSFCKSSYTQLDGHASIIDPFLEVQYQWQLNGNDISGATAIDLDQVSVAGDYNFIVSTHAGCVGKSPVFSVKESINPQPIISGSHWICKQTPLALNLLGSNANDGDIVMIQWFLNDIEIPGETDYTLITNDTGKYSAITYNSAGCSAASADFSVKLNTLNLKISSSLKGLGFNTTCAESADADVKINVISGIAPYKYLWSNMETTNNIKGIGAGMYHILLSDSVGCRLRDSIQINSPPPIKVDAGIDIKLCCQETYKLGGNPTALGGSAPYSYNWTSDGLLDYSNISNPLLKLFSVTNTMQAMKSHVLVTDAMGCQSVSTQNINIYPRDSVNIIKYDIPDFIQGNGVKLSAYSPSSASFQWSDQSLSQSVFAHSSGVYSVIVTDTNLCVQSDSIQVLLNPENILSSYTVLVKEYALFSGNIIRSGSIGVEGGNSNGKSGVDFEKNSKILNSGSFVKAEKINIKSGSSISKPIYSAAKGLSLPYFPINTYTSSNDIFIADGAVINLNDSIYGKIDVGKNAKIIFGAKRIFIENLSMNHKDGISIEFNNCCRVVVKNSVDFGKNSRVNMSKGFVVFYVGQDDDAGTNKNHKAIEIDGGSNINANFYAPNGEIDIYPATNTKPNLMEGLNIAKRLSSGANTEWSLSSYLKLCNLSATITKKMDVKCFGEKNGQIEVLAEGGISPYKFSLDGKNYFDSGNFKQLTAGNYQISIKDAIGSEIKLNTSIQQANTKLKLSLTSNAISQDSLVGSDNCYKIIAIGSGGMNPLNYQWKSAAIENMDSDTSILVCPEKNETFICMLMDSNHCLIIDSVRIDSHHPRLGALQTIPCYDCLGSFSPDPGKKYIFSAWVKEENADPSVTTYTSPEVIIQFVSSKISLPPMHAKGQIIDGWQRIEDSFTIPSSASNIKILLNSVKGNSYFDDLRIFPANGSMKSFVYDPYSLSLIAELDANNYASIFEYDEEGKLTRVKKETERGIMTIKETKENIVKK